MATASAAMHLGTQHAQGAVFGDADGVLQRLIEARPAGAAVELGLGGEQRQVAAGAGKSPLAMLLQERAGPGALSALLAQDLILLRGELRTPLGVGLFDLERLRGLRWQRLEETQARKSKQAGNSCKQNTAVDHDSLRVRQACWFGLKYGSPRQNLHRPKRFSLTFMRAALGPLAVPVISGDRRLTSRRARRTASGGRALRERARCGLAICLSKPRLAQPLL